MCNHVFYVRIQLFFINAFLRKRFQICLRINDHTISNLKKKIEIFILYNSIIFITIEIHYFIYKRKLCVFIKFVIKYNHFCKHFKIIVIVYTNHKFLIQFFRTNSYENIYEH